MPPVDPEADRVSFVVHSGWYGKGVKIEDIHGCRVGRLVVVVDMMTVRLSNFSWILVIIGFVVNAAFSVCVWLC